MKLSEGMMRSHRGMISIRSARHTDVFPAKIFAHYHIFISATLKPKLMRPGKVIGWLLIIGAVGVLIPYTILTISFDYPGILRNETSVILLKFHKGGSKLIWTWFWFALGGITLIPAY